MFPQYCSSNSDFWCEDNSASASADDVDYFLDEALSVETEDDLPPEECVWNPNYRDDNNCCYHHASIGMQFGDFEDDEEEETTGNGSVYISHRLPPEMYEDDDGVGGNMNGRMLMASNNSNGVVKTEGRMRPRVPGNVYADGMMSSPAVIGSTPLLDRRFPEQTPLIPLSHHPVLDRSAFATTTPPLIPIPAPVFLKPGEFLVPPKPVHIQKRKMPEKTVEPDEIPKLDIKKEEDPSNSGESSVNNDGSTKSDAKKRPSFPRKQFRETVGALICKDLMSEQYSYEEIIVKYSALYPEYASKFTPSFCSKVRCGRIMNPESTKIKGVSKPKSRVKRVSKLSHRKTWRKMTPELFNEISAWEKNQNRPVKQVEFEQLFNVNRSTYYRWKKAQSKASTMQTKNFGN